MEWPKRPEWQDINTINGGQQYVAQDGVVYSDFNAIIENIIHLKNLAR